MCQPRFPHRKPCFSVKVSSGVVPGGASPTFTEDTLPDKLQAEHTLAPGHWAVLNLLEGSLRFVNHETQEDRLISALRANRRSCRSSRSRAPA